MYLLLLLFILNIPKSKTQLILLCMPFSLSELSCYQNITHMMQVVRKRFMLHSICRFILSLCAGFVFLPKIIFPSVY